MILYNILGMAAIDNLLESPSTPQYLHITYYILTYLRDTYKEQICANPFSLFKKSSNAFILKAHVLPLYKLQRVAPFFLLLQISLAL